MSSKKKRSRVWDLFDTNQENAICKFCEVSIKIPNSKQTSNLWTHIRSNHIDKLDEEYDCILSDEYKRSIDKLIEDVILFNLLPFSVVNHHGFRNIFKFFVPNYKIPSINSIRRRVSDRVIKSKEHIHEMIRSIKSPYSCTFDLWKSKYNDYFIGITVHCLDNNWKLNRFTFDLVPISDNHTAVNISQLVYQTLNSKIEESPFAIITDNAANVQASCRELKSLYGNDIFYFGCYCHSLHLTVMNGLDVIHNELASIRTFTSSIKNSDPLYRAFTDIQLSLGRKPITINKDSKTRWSSTYFMMDRILKLKDCIIKLNNELMKDDFIKKYNIKENFDVLSFSDRVWILLEKICSLLRPIHDVTEFLEGDSYPTLPFITLLIQFLRDTTQKRSDEEKSKVYFSERFISFCKTLINELDNRFADIKKREEYVICILLNPT